MSDQLPPPDGAVPPPPFDPSSLSETPMPAAAAPSDPRVTPPPPSASPPPPGSSFPPPPGSGFPPPPEAQEEDNRRRPLLWMIPVAILIILGAVVGVFFAVGDKGEAPAEVAATAEATDVELAFSGEDTTDDDPTFELASEVGRDPFVSPQDLMDDLDASFPADTPYGLFGGTLDSTCDPERLADYLEANPHKGAAWATVQGISPANLRAYILSLTPSVLAVDTAVTNHGFSNGSAYAIQATLEAGTAVLIDNNGVPRTRCYCGNPLLPPELDDVAAPATTVPQASSTTLPSTTLTSSTVTSSTPSSTTTSSTVSCLALDAEMWIGRNGQNAITNGTSLVAPRPWAVVPTGSTQTVSGNVFVELELDFASGWLHSIGEFDQPDDDLWVLASSLTSSGCETELVCYDGVSDLLPDLEGAAGLLQSMTEANLTGATQQVGSATWHQVEIVSIDLEATYTFAWVQESGWSAGPCGEVATTQPAVNACAPEQMASSTTTYEVVNVAADDPDGGLVMRADASSSSARTGVLTYDAAFLLILDCRLASNGTPWWKVDGGDWVNSTYLAPMTGERQP